MYMYVLYNICLFYTEAFSNKMNPKNKASGGKQNISITKEVHTAGYNKLKTKTQKIIH